MAAILLLIGLFLMVLASYKAVALPVTDISDWEEKGDIWRWNVGDYPNPQTHPKFCQRFAPSNVCDPDSILTKEEADNLDSAIRLVYNDTSCLCPGCSSSFGGIIIGIAVMKRIFIPYYEHKSAVIRDFADELRKLWSFGECKNEIIIVLVTEDRVSYTSVGPGISPYISPQESRIFAENKGHFTIGKYYEGLSSMIHAYYDLSRSIKLEKEEELVSAGLIAGLVLGVLLLVVLIILVGCTLHRRLSHPPSLRKESWDGDPSLSWKKTQYQRCSTQDIEEKVAVPKHGNTENNNDQFINKSLQGRIAPDAGNEVVAPNQTLLTTVPELENEDSSSKDESAQEQKIQKTNVKGKNETELKCTEVEINLPAPLTNYSGTVTNL